MEVRTAASYHYETKLLLKKRTPVFFAKWTTRNTVWKGVCYSEWTC